MNKVIQCPALVAKAREHARETHGMEVTDELVEAVRRAIKDE